MLHSKADSRYKLHSSRFWVQLAGSFVKQTSKQNDFRQMKPGLKGPGTLAYFLTRFGRLLQLLRFHVEALPIRGWTCRAGAGGSVPHWLVEPL